MSLTTFATGTCRIRRPKMSCTQQKSQLYGQPRVVITGSTSNNRLRVCRR